MSILETLKRWLGLAPKPQQTDAEPEPEHKTVTLPNGRKAVVDQCGNFIKWLNSP